MRGHQTCTCISLVCVLAGLSLASTPGALTAADEASSRSEPQPVVRLARRARPYQRNAPQAKPRSVRDVPPTRTAKRVDHAQSKLATPVSIKRIVPEGRIRVSRLIDPPQPQTEPEIRTPSETPNTKLRVPEKGFAELTIDTAPDVRNLSAGRTDQSPAVTSIQLPQSEPPPATVGVIDRTYRWHSTAFEWTAPQFFHRPLYFEQPNLERYGHFKKHWHLASAMSAAHFFGTLPALPYMIGKDRPCYRIYTLGHLRPGDCNPRQAKPKDFSTHGAILQGVAVGGLIFLIP